MYNVCVCIHLHVVCVYVCVCVLTVGFLLIKSAGLMDSLVNWD